MWQLYLRSGDYLKLLSAVVKLNFPADSFTEVPAAFFFFFFFFHVYTNNCETLIQWNQTESAWGNTSGLLNTKQNKAKLSFFKSSRLLVEQSQFSLGLLF